MKFIFGKERICSLEIEPELIKKEFGGIRDIAILGEAHDCPRITLGIIAKEPFDVDTGDSVVSLEFWDYQTKEYKPVSKIIYQDGTETNYPMREFS